MKRPAFQKAPPFQLKTVIFIVPLSLFYVNYIQSFYYPINGERSCKMKKEDIKSIYKLISLPEGVFIYDQDPKN